MREDIMHSVRNRISSKEVENDAQTTRTGRGRVTAQIRPSDGTSIVTELFASYPVRLHLTSRPNNKEQCNSNSNGSAENDRQARNGHTKQHKALCCYVLGYGGGLVSGDSIDLQFNVDPLASLVITSQSTAKAFKSIPGRPSTSVRTTANVGGGSLLVLVPQPTQCFATSKMEQETHAYMKFDESIVSTETKEPSLLLVDWYTGGRANLDNGLWKLDSFRSTTTIHYARSSSTQNETNNAFDASSYRMVFRDATRLTGGKELQRHMRNFNTVCMVVLLGPRVKSAAHRFMQKFSSRNSFWDDEDELVPRKGDNSRPSSIQRSNDNGHGMFRDLNLCNGNDDRREGLNTDGLLVSCGTFPTVPECEEQGVVLRLAARSIEQAANFLSRHIGTLDGQLEDDPFLEILASRQVNNFINISQNEATSSTEPRRYQNLSFELMENSFTEDACKVHRDSPLDDGTKLNTTQKQNPRVKISPITLYQLVDSNAPTGGFAHSNTVEVAHQLHFIDLSRSVYPLMQHIWDVMLQTTTSILPFLVRACEMLRSCSFVGVSNGTFILPENDDILDEWETLDAELSATLTSHVSRRASTIQGSAMLRTYAKTFPHIAPALNALKSRVVLAASSSARSSSSSSRDAGNSATCFGAICGLLDIDEKTCASMFSYNTTRDMINAAVRMNLIGPLEGGRLVNEICSRLETLLEDLLAQVFRVSSIHCETLTATIKLSEAASFSDPGAAHQVAPLVEILANAHDRLYTRLFNS